MSHKEVVWTRVGEFQLWESLYKGASEQYINFPKNVFVAIEYHSYTE